MININFEELRNKIIDCYNYEPDPEYKKRLEEYHKKIEDDFQEAWSKKKFKWFFKKYRQAKLKAHIYRYSYGPVFWIIEDVLEETLPKQCEHSEFFGKFVDVKNIAVGDENCRVNKEIEELANKVYQSFGCTSFNITEEDLKHLNTPTLDSSHPCYGCCHYEGCGYFDFHDYDKTEEWNMVENCVGCCCGDGWECNKHSDYGCSNYEIEPILG